jgi:probable lipoprotein NlpC
MKIGVATMFAIKDRCRPFGRFYVCQLLVITFVFLYLQGCAPKVQVSYIPQQKRSLGAEKPVYGKENALLLKRHYEKWRGTPYIDGGMSASGIDCSGFTVLAYRDLFGLSLPRTAGEQAESGREVARTSLRTGDLVFFNTGGSKKHVGIYLADDQFIHASLSKGVTLSSLDDSYWQEKYWQARRLQQAPIGQDKATSTVVATYRR